MASLNDADHRHLAALVAVVEHGTFARAAEALGFTQSAVSQQIAQLERATGIALFDRPRGPRPAELTEAGRMMLEYAHQALVRSDQMDERLDMLKRGVAGRLVVGTFQSASAELLPNILGRMRHEVPDVEVQLDETDDLEELHRDVLTDVCDLAFTIDAPDDERLSVELVGRDAFVVLVPAADAPTRAGASVTVSDLNRHPLIGQPGNETGQRMIEQRMIAAGIVAEYAFRLHNNAAVQSMVRSGMGWAVMPSLAIAPNDPGVAVVQLDPPLPPRTIQLIRRTGRTLIPAAERFRTIATDTGRALLTS